MRSLLLAFFGILFLAMPTSATNMERIDLGRFKLTAYSGSHQKHTRIPVTASGKVAAAGRSVAVDPRVIRMGSKIEIDGLGRRVAEDTGGKIKGKIIDVYVASVPIARLFGVRYANVAIIY